MTTRMVLAGLVIGLLGVPLTAEQRPGQPARGRAPQVQLVQTVGCVEQRGGAADWWLVRAADPTVTRAGVFNVVQVEEMKQALTLGSKQFHLVGVADFLDAEGLLRTGDRAQFTTPESANATGELRVGRTVLVKGLLIETDEGLRINLTNVVGLADNCG